MAGKLRAPRPYWRVGGRGNGSRRPGLRPSPCSPAIVALPLATIVVLSFTAPDNAWPHLMRTVLPGALADTALLLVGRRRALPGVRHRHRLAHHHVPLPGPRPCSTACWCCRWRCRPTSSPTATWSCSTSPGPVQRLLRAMFGWHTVRDYWFPEVRTLPGAILVLSAVLYPYVYLSARASFVQQSVCVLEVARTLGRTVGADLLGGGAAAGATGAGGRRGARVDGVPERSGRRAVPGRADADGQRLHHLAAALEPGRGSPDRAGRAAVRAGADASPSGPRAAAAASITPPAAIARSRSPTWRAGAATPPRPSAACRCWPASWRRSRCCWCRPRRTCRMRCRRLLAGGAQQRQHLRWWRRW